MATTQIVVFRGDNQTIRVTVKDTLGVVINITGARIIFNAATRLTGITKDSLNGVTEVALTDPTHGVAEIYLVPADTSSKEVGTYVFDVQMTLGGKVYTLVKGFFQIEADVTP